MKKIIFLLLLSIINLKGYSQDFNEKYNSYIDTINVFNKEIVYLRVPKKKIKSPAKDYILSIQNTLDKIQNDIKDGKTINSTYKYNLKSSLNSINYRDKKWELGFYEKEYKSYEEIIDYKSKKEWSNYLNSQRKEYEEEKAKAEEELNKNMRFVDIGELTIYSDTLKTAKDIGHLPAYCAIKLVKELDNGYSEIVACGQKSGYVKSEYLVTNKNLVTVESELKKIEHNFCYVIYPDDDDMYYQGYIPERDRVYYLGPKGGCYYLTNNGHKVYVDRSVCN